MFFIPFSREAKKRKEIKATLNAARVFVLSHEDLPEYRSGQAAASFSALNTAWREKNAERCGELLSELDLMDARVYQIGHAVEGIDAGEFSSRLWALDDRKIYNHDMRDKDIKVNLD